MAWIPGVLALTDCVMGLASGMTIKFFPIFFKDKVEIRPPACVCASIASFCTAGISTNQSHVC